MTYDASDAGYRATTPVQQRRDTGRAGSPRDTARRVTVTQDSTISRDEDRATVHHYIRLFGRTPTDEELLRFREARARVVPVRGVRRRAARLIVRL